MAAQAVAVGPVTEPFRRRPRCLPHYNPMPQRVRPASLTGLPTEGPAARAAQNGSSGGLATVSISSLPMDEVPSAQDVPEAANSLCALQCDRSSFAGPYHVPAIGTGDWLGCDGP